MIEIRFHGKKGQGAIEAARLLAGAWRIAGRDAGWHVRPWFERGDGFEGACAVSETRSSQLRALVLFYPPLIEQPDVWTSFDNPDIVLINTHSFTEGDLVPELSGLAEVDAIGIARSVGIYSGLPNLVAPMLGALAAVTGVTTGCKIMGAFRSAASAFGMTGSDMERVFRAIELGYDAASILRGKHAVHCGSPEIEAVLFAS